MPNLIFASCMDAERQAQQPVWDHMREHGVPDVLLLLGDLVYMDWGLASLARKPAALRAWEDTKAAKRHELISSFAEDLHARYALQWNIPGFRALLNAMPQPRQVLLCWDDHDFAWNNSTGRHSTGKPELNDKLVPPALKRVSQLLRDQFHAQLRGPTNATYPPIPPAVLTIDPAQGDVDPPPPRQVTDLGHVTVAVLDQRFSRTHRDAEAAQLLAPADRAWLEGQLQHSAEGLLILAGGSPLKHRSLLGGHSSWWAGPGEGAPGQDRSYGEYGALLQTQRPVLYLSGEIHRNAWGGWVELPPVGGGPRVPVLQALSSGAGLGNLLFHRFPGAYGRVTLTGSATQGQLEVRLVTLPDTEETRVLKLVEGRLQPDPGLEGECTQPSLSTDADQRLLSQVTAEPMPVICLRQPVAPTDDGQAFGPGRFVDADPTRLDVDVFRDQLTSNTDWPLCCTVAGQGAQVRVSRPLGLTESDRVNSLLNQVFAHPDAAGKGVLLFVHGFGKGFAASVSQAAELQARYGCRVVLLAWPAGSGEGLLSVVGSFADAKAAATSAHRLLVATIGSFFNCAKSHPLVHAVLMARSLGCLTLTEFEDPHGVIADAKCLKRVVLSAPALKKSKLKKIAAWPTEVVVTVNRNDRTLKWAKSPGSGKMVGNDKIDPVPGQVKYLDCTDVPGVGTAHDYLLRDVNGPLTALHQMLLSGQPLTWPPTSVPGLVVRP